MAECATLSRKGRCSLAAIVLADVLDRITLRSTQTQGNNVLITRDLLSRVGSKRVRRRTTTRAKKSTTTSMASVDVNSDGPMAFVAMDAQFRTSIECRELGVPFVPCDLFASQDDADDRNYGRD